MTPDTAFLFDTDAISEPFRKRPLPAYLSWLSRLPIELQFTSAVVIGELYSGAHRQRAPEHLFTIIEERVVPYITVLPYDAAVARVFGRLDAELQNAGMQLAAPDLHIAATAIHHDLELVTGNIRHFERIRGLRLCCALSSARKEPPD
ncbi:MAG TPA: type II toxin-antitoxin system VapC family toxin [Gemmatimonadota bacterium]|nr:type II toxin-antitoxin system VapC family toxin [Gemmatimonadota bacterium]